MHGCMKWNGNMRSPCFILLLKFRSTSTIWEHTMCQMLGSVFLHMTIKKKQLDTVLALADHKHPFDLSSGFCYLFPKRKTCLLFTEAQVCWCSMLCESNKHSSEILMLIFLFFSYLPSCRDDEHSSIWGQKSYHLWVLHDWQCYAVQKEIDSSIASKIYRSFCLVSLDNLDKIDMTISLHIKGKCAISKHYL